MNWGIVFETVLGLILGFAPFLWRPLGSRMLRPWHWGIPALPYYTLIFIYEEVRKYWVREIKTKSGGKGWA